MHPVLMHTAQRYHQSGRFDRCYINGKLRRDPIFGDLLDLSGDGLGDVVDVGCGRGQVGLVLLEAGVASSVLGLDRNTAHLAQARQAANGLPFRAIVRDLAQEQSLPDADTILLIDVLYQLDTPVQQALLANATRAARQRIVIRTADPQRGLRSVATRMLEVLSRPIWPNAGAHVNARPIASLAHVLQSAGFSVSVTPCWRGTPLANVLLAARRQFAATC